MAKSSAAKIRGRDKAARPARSAPSIGMAARGSARVGIELDGGVAHIVTVGADGMVSYHRIEQTNNTIALAEALKSFGRNDAIQVALTSEHQSVRRLSIPNVPQHALPMALRSAAEEHMPMSSGGVAVAGLQVPNPDLASGPTMTVAAVSASETAPLLRQLGAARPVTISSFLLPADGLYLRVARSAAELILVRDGAPAAVRSLRSGGVARLVGDMQHGTGTMYLGTESASNHVDAYVDEVVGDVRRTIVFWRREGMNVPDQLTIIGEGAALHQLEQRLRDASYEIMPVPAPQGLNFSGMRIEDRPVAFQAVAAALMDLHSQPFAALIDGVSVEPEVTESANAIPKLVALLCGVACIALLAFGAMQWLSARNELKDIERRRTEALATLAQPETQAALKLNRDVEVGKAQVQKLRDGDALMAVIFDKLLAASPEGTKFKNVSLTNTGTTVTGTVDATVPGGDDTHGFKPIGVWQDRFLAMQRSANGTTNLDAWPGSVKRGDNNLNQVQFAFSVNVNAFKPAGGTK